MKRKRLQKMIALAVCTAVITTMGGFSAAAEEVYEVAADEETVTDVPAEPETEDIFQEVGEDEEQLLQQIQEENEEADVLFGDGTVIEEFSSGEATTDLQYESLSKVYLDSAGGSDTNSGEASDQAVKTIDQALSLIEENGTIYLISSLTLNDKKDHRWSKVTIRPANTLADDESKPMIQILKGTGLALDEVNISNIKESGGSWLGKTLLEKTGEGVLTIGTGTTLVCDAKVKHAIYTNKESGANGTYATLRINGGSIQGADRTNYDEQTALVTVWYGTAEMSGGSITGNTAHYGGGIYLYKARFFMSGGQISGNKARHGGGIYGENGSTVTLSGGRIADNQAGDGGGVYLWGSDLKMDRTEPDGQPCVIEKNTATADTLNDVYGQGGGVYLGDGRALLGKGTIQGNKAEPQIKYDEDGEVIGSTGGMGGGVHAFNGSIELTAARICNNQTFTGGGIFTQSTEVIDALKMTGGEITGNVAARMGAGICASLWYPNDYYDGSGQVIAHQNMDLEISGGKISGNMSGEGENVDENAITLDLVCYSEFDENVKFPTLHLSGSPEIKGYVMLMDYSDPVCSPKVVVDDTFTPVNPVEMKGAYCEPGVVAVKWKDGLTPDASLFTVDKGFGSELKLNGQTLTWVERVRVTFYWTEKQGDRYYRRNKNLYILPGNKVDPSEIPAQTELPGYTFKGWVDVDDHDWTPDMEITESIRLYENWSLNAPSVTLTADRENSCFTLPVTLTARASHEISTAKLTYQWYKDGTLLDGLTEAECKVSEPGEYKVVVTVTSGTFTATKDAVLTISQKDHEYTWKFDDKAHWQICNLDGETTESKGHTFGEWKVVKEAAVSVTGEKERTCTVCGYKETEVIAALPAPTPTPAVAPPTPTPVPVQTPVHLSSLTSKKTSITIKWNRIKGASGYKIYGSKCGKDYKLLKTVKGSVTKWTHKDLKANTYYKYYVAAYKTVNGKQTILSKTPAMHIPTTGGKFSKVTAVNVKKESITLKKGRKTSVKASVVNSDGKVVKHVAVLRYMSSNKKVATVNSKGVITAQGKGKCTIYCYAQNGLRKSVKVTVK